MEFWFWVGEFWNLVEFGISWFWNFGMRVLEFSSSFGIGRFGIGGFGNGFLGLLELRVPEFWKWQFWNWQNEFWNSGFGILKLEFWK